MKNVVFQCIYVRIVSSHYVKNVCIQSECGKIQTRRIPNTGTFHEVSFKSKKLHVDANLLELLYSRGDLMRVYYLSRKTIFRNLNEIHNISRNSNFHFNLLLLLSGDKGLNPGPMHNVRCNLKANGVFLIREDFILSTSTLVVWYSKLTNLDVLSNYLIQQL